MFGDFFDTFLTQSPGGEAREDLFETFWGFRAQRPCGDSCIWGLQSQNKHPCAWSMLFQDYDWAWFHRTAEVIPHHPWKSKSPFVSRPMRFSMNTCAHKVRHSTSVVLFKCPVLRSSSRIGHRFFNCKRRLLHNIRDVLRFFSSHSSFQDMPP